MATVSARYCDACGNGTQANHALLWIDGIGDALTFQIPVHRFPLYSALMRLTDALVIGLGRGMLLLGRICRFATFSDDHSHAVSERSRLLWDEAERRGIFLQQVFLFGRPTDIFRIRHAGRTHLFTSLPHSVPPSALRMDDKVLFKRTMRDAGLPVPMSYSVTSAREGEAALTSLGIVCVKPRTGSNGRHTYPHVSTKEELHAALRSVHQIAPFASVETHLEGDLCRATCVDGKLLGFLRSEHPHVFGDGSSSIRELISVWNAARQDGTEEMAIDSVMTDYVRRRGYALDDVLSDGERLQLTYRGGRSVASTNREHGREIHPSFIPIIEKAAHATELPVVGFDIIIPDPMQQEEGQKWGFIEANSLPWIDLHAHPYYGEPHDLSGAVWELWERQQGLITN